MFNQKTTKWLAGTIEMRDSTLQEIIRALRGMDTYSKETAKFHQLTHQLTKWTSFSGPGNRATYDPCHGTCVDVSNVGTTKPTEWQPTLM